MRYLRTRHQDGSEKNDCVRVLALNPRWLIVKDEGSQIGEVKKESDGWYAWKNSIMDTSPISGPFQDRDVAIDAVLTNDRKPRRRPARNSK